jgi:uncharacterized integral membrane protein
VLAAGPPVNEAQPPVGNEEGTHTAQQPVNREEGPHATRAGRTWVGVAIGLLALILVLVFILQNLQSVHVTYFASSGTIPLAVALLLAAILGALTVLLIGSLRILQLRGQLRGRQGSRFRRPHRHSRHSSAARGAG